MTKKASLAFALVAGVIWLSASVTLFPEAETINQLKRKEAKFTRSNRPQIKQLLQEFAGHPYTEIAIKGLNFGDAQGDKQVYFDSTPNTNPVAWASSILGLVIPGNLQYGQEHIVSIWRNGARISNKFKFMLLRALDGAEPSQGSAGKTISLSGFHLGSSQGSKKLMMKTTVVSAIVSWTDGQIVFKVPAGVAPVPCELFIMDGGKVVSNKNAFKVL